MSLVDPDGNHPVVVLLWIIKEAGSEVVERTTGIPMPTLKNGSKLVVKQLIKKAKKKVVKPGDTGTYKELLTQKRKHGESEKLDMDHQPSFAAQKKNLENKLNRKLTPDENKALKSNSPAIASPRKVHQQTSPTYGGRNNSNRIAEDAQDLSSAKNRDRAIFDNAMKNRGE